MTFSTPDLCDEFPDVDILELPLRDFGGKSVFGGKVATVKCFEDNSMVREMVGRPGQGQVLVVDGGGSLRRALLGDRLAAKAIANGWSGVVINGCLRDVEIIGDMNLGVKALAPCPRKTEKRGLGDIGVPIRIGGVDITPGDYLYADRNGVILAKKKLVSDYIIGGWSQRLDAAPPASFSYTMYGMITNLEGLTSGTAVSPGWSPARRSAPESAGQVLWTYGGGLCSPEGRPKDQEDIDRIVQVTGDKGWAGVDFDDECNMNLDNIVAAMKALKPLSTSYTFLAGTAYNNPNEYGHGQATNQAVRQLVEAGCCDRFVLMCYAASMWSRDDYVDNVGPAIQRTIDNGVQPKQVILALTPRGLNAENLDYFLGQVLAHDIGGLFIWNYPTLEPADLETISQRLGLNA